MQRSVLIRKLTVPRVYRAACSFWRVAEPYVPSVACGQAAMQHVGAHTSLAWIPRVLVYLAALNGV